MASLLRPRSLAKLLDQVSTGGVVSAMLISTDGILLASMHSAQQSEKTMAAIAASIWSVYQQQVCMDDSVQEIIVLLEEGRILVSRLSSVLLCLQGSNTVNLGLLRAKLRILLEHLEEPLSILASP